MFNLIVSALALVGLGTLAILVARLFTRTTFQEWKDEDDIGDWCDRLKM